MDLVFEEKSVVLESGETVNFSEAVYHGYVDWYVGCFGRCYYLSDASWTEEVEDSFVEGEWDESQLGELKAYILELDDKEREWWGSHRQD